MARRVAEALPPLIEEAKVAGLTMLAYNLWMAAHEAERIARRAAGGNEDEDGGSAALP